MENRVQMEKQTCSAQLGAPAGKPTKKEGLALISDYLPEVHLKHRLFNQGG